jgi:WD40 repeat protein/mono/diheme cytochrome c family protein
MMATMVAAMLLACTTIALAADEPATAAKVSYYKDIRPIFQEHCQGCHQPAKPLGGLTMTSFEGAKKGGESEEPGFVPGKPEESSLVIQITSQNGDAPAMPKDKPPLAQTQVDLIKRWIAEGAVDDTPPMAREAIDKDHPPTYTLAPVLTSLDYSPDGKLIAVSGYHEVLLHHADGSGIAGRLVGLAERIESAVFSPDGKQLAVTGGSPGRFGEVQIWDVASQELKLSLPVTFDTIYGANWSKDGKLVSFGCSDNTLRAIEAETGKQVLYQGAHSEWVLDTVFSTDGSHLVSVSRDRSMKLTDVPTQRFEDNITSITPGALKGGLISVDRHPTKDEVCVGGADGVPKIYRIYREQGKDRKIGDDFNLIRNFDPLPGRVFSVQYNADGSRVVAGSSKDNRGEVRVYESEDGKLVSKIELPTSAVYAVAFSPDGQTVAIAGFDGVVRLHEADTGKAIKEFTAVPLSASVASKD